MSESATDENAIQGAHEQVLVDDAPTSLNTIPLSGTVLVNSIFSRIHRFEQS